MHVHVACRGAKHPVLVECRFADTQLVSRAVQCGNIRSLIGRIVDHEQRIDDGFRCKVGDGCGTNVLDASSPVAEGRPDTLGFRCELLVPGGIVVDQDDLLPFDVADDHIVKPFDRRISLG